MNIRFRPWTPAIIYGILAVGLISIFLAWRMLPKQASRITIVGTDGRTIGDYMLKDSGDVLRYRFADEVLQIFVHGRIDIFPVGNVRTVEIRP